MKTEDQTDRQPQVAVVCDGANTCSSCGRKFTPRWLSGLKKWSSVCGNCGILNLARFMEDDSDPGMTLADISAGEQSGAFLRGLVKTNAKLSGSEGGKD